jgi:aminomethyltransferase
MDVTIEDISEQMAAVSLQGPASLRILQQLGDIPALKYFRLAPAALRGIPVTVSRTGYTGDLGFEIWADAQHAVPLWDALVEAGTPHGIVPAGMLALDVARIEAGLMLIDVDYVPARKALIESQLSSPYELDLGWTVNLKKERFIGRQALAAEAERGPQWQFVGVEVDWGSLERLYAEVGLATRLPPSAWRTSVPIYASGEQAGYATSGGWSPLLKKYIALAHLRAQWARPGTQLEMEITVEHRRKRAAVQVVKKPFFDPERKRA